MVKISLYFWNFQIKRWNVVWDDCSTYWDRSRTLWVLTRASQQANTKITTWKLKQKIKQMLTELNPVEDKLSGLEGDLVFIWGTVASQQSAGRDILGNLGVKTGPTTMNKLPSGCFDFLDLRALFAAHPSFTSLSGEKFRKRLLAK